MGQQANSKRHASLDEKKLRAAGRSKERARSEIREALDEQFAKGRTGGATGASPSKMSAKGR